MGLIGSQKVRPVNAPASTDNTRLPAYVRVGRTICERISAGYYRADEFLPPERDLAREFGVSRQSVRQAIDTLRQDGIVSPEQGRGTRVLAQASAAATPRPERNGFKLAALVIYRMTGDGSAAMFRGCQQALAETDHHLIVCETPIDTRTRSLNEADHLRKLIDRGIGGIVIYAEPTASNLALLAEAAQRGAPVVQIDRELPGLACDFVGVDNRAAAQRMTEHLLSLGHRRIAFLSTAPGPSTCAERLQGYREALGECGSAYDLSDLVAHVPDGAALHGIAEAWLALADPPTAVFAVNDRLAVRFMQALARLGVSVPDTLAVVGFDNSRWAEVVTPALTTVEQPFAAIGETAAHLLVDRMSRRYTGPPRRVLLPTRLVVRQSCGAATPRTRAAAPDEV